MRAGSMNAAIMPPLRPLSLSRRGRRPGSERALHQHDVDPIAELEADRRQQADADEAERLVQPDRRPLLAPADHRHHLPIAEPAAAPDQIGQQGPTDAAADLVRRDIDRILERETVGRARAVRPGIAIADDPAVALGDQIRQTAGEDLVPAGPPGEPDWPARELPWPPRELAGSSWEPPGPPGWPPRGAPRRLSRWPGE